MKKSFLTLCSCLMTAFFCFCQIPAVKWTKYITKTDRGFFGSDDDGFLFDIKPTSDLGFIVAGADSASGAATSVALNRSVSAMPWLVKLDSNGNKTWYSGPFNPNLNAQKSAFLSVQQTISNDYIAVGYAGDYRDSDPGKFYFTKIRNDGLFLWDKMYGGTGDDRAYCIKELGTDGFVAVGYTNSNDGDVTGNHQAGTADVWLVRVDVSGNVVWKKCFGGTGSDTAFAVIHTPDNGFLIAGTSNSNNGNVTANAGGTDAWVFKTDNAGNLEWQKSFGGAGNDAFKSVIANADGSYTFVGCSSSTGYLGTTNAGRNDVWVVRTDASGQVIWSRLFGGTMDDQAYSVQETPSGNMLVCGYTQSNDGHVSGNNGATDAWLLKISSGGSLLWQKTIGTSRDEAGFGVACVSENSFVVAGFGKPAGYNDNDGYIVGFGNSNTIKGTLFRDDNLNGIKDASEALFSQQATVTVQGSDGSHTAITENGQFSIDVDTGGHSTYVQANQLYYRVVPPFQNSMFRTYGNTDSLIFAVQPISNKKDLVVSIVPRGPARPGFTASYTLFYKNNGTTTIDAGVVSFKKDYRTTLTFAVPAPTTVNADTLKWTYNSLGPGDTASIDFDLRIAAPPLANVNDTLFYTAIIDPVTGDETPSNDTARLKQRVTGSFDPNDLSESNAGSVPVSFVTNGNYLQYTIRFQNTGTDLAFNVSVKDTLSSRLDAGSLELVTASHPYSLAVQNNNQLIWQFNNINLPDSNANVAGSHGYIVYRVRLKPDVQRGELIHNKASIYFDFNLPVATNDASTLISSDVILLPQGLLSFSGNQQNGKIVLFWKVADATRLKQFDVERSVNGKDFLHVGSQTAESTLKSYSFKDDGSQIASRTLFYRLKLLRNDGSFQYSNVLLFRTGNQQENAVEIYPNPAKNGATLAFRSTQNGKAEIQILNMNGTVMKKMQILVMPGHNTYSLNGYLPITPGTYLVRLIMDDEIFTARFVLQ